MARLHYVGVLEKGPEGFGAFFPDFPGCVAAAPTADETLREAREALSFHVEGMIEDGLALPQATSIHAYGEDDFPGVAVETLFWAPVDVPGVVQDSPVRVNVTLPQTLLERIDAYASARDLTRSGFLASAARDFMARRRAEQG